ncbi:MAG: AmmeMemoRadiSam system protein A [Gammaproteobacteria bacterium]|nr:AmmeMemoRadiSam system protein A [Gammaproteobacteria bacterium]
MHSTESESAPLSTDDSNRLLELAFGSIDNGLNSGHALSVRAEDYSERLREKRACFVTLNKFKVLRGCIGHLEAMQTLVEDVVENAYSAAFRDPRFSPLQRSELDSLEIHISVLTPSSPMTFDSEADLIEKLRPGADGLILQSGRRRGTFLPSVWESLPEPRSFLTQLKMKAGLPADYWSDDVRISRYTTQSYSSTPSGALSRRQ